MAVFHLLFIFSIFVDFYLKIANKFMAWVIFVRLWKSWEIQLFGASSTKTTNSGSHTLCKKAWLTKFVRRNKVQNKQLFSHITTVHRPTIFPYVSKIFSHSRQVELANKICLQNVALWVQPTWCTRIASILQYKVRTFFPVQKAILRQTPIQLSIRHRRLLHR